jgi:hypothetical protein
MTDTQPNTDLLAALYALIAERDAAAEAFDLFKQDAIMAHAPEAGDAPIVSSDDAAEVAADEVVRFNADVAALIDSAPDAALAAAYAQTDGAVGDLAAEILHGAMTRRGIAS